MTPESPINELAAALAAAQGEMQNAPLNKVNPHFKSRYADLAAIRDATIPALSKHGLSLTQQPVFSEAGLMLITRLMHASGQWLESSYPLPMGGRPQEMGSALTYARRYSWQSMCGISAEDDDDANAAQEATPRNGSRQPVKRTQAEISGQKATRENNHAEFERELAEVDNLIALSRFEDAWAHKLKGEGGHVWTMQEKLERRRAELSEHVEDEPDADGVLPSPEPTTRPDYVRYAHDAIADMTTDAAMRTWWSVETLRRRRFSLGQPEIDSLKDRMMERKAELDMPAAVTAAGELIAGAG